MSDSTRATPNPPQIGRRAALKATAAAGVAAVVWSEPTIKGFASRPAYAAVGTGPDVDVTVTGTLALSGLDPIANLTATISGGGGEFAGLTAVLTEEACVVISLPGDYQFDNLNDPNNQVIAPLGSPNPTLTLNKDLLDGTAISFTATLVC